MWGLIILILLSLLLYLWLKSILHKNFITVKNDYFKLKNEYNKLFAKNTKLKQDNLNLEKIADQTLALYDITSNICKSLEEDKVFNLFKDEINKYIEVSDCQFLKADVDSAEYKDRTVVPLEINKKPIGYLVARGVKEQERDKFYILAHQFILGIKRAHLYQKVQELAITDSLTGVFSRRYYLERLNEEIERSKKFNYSFAFLMADIDHFKEHNDRYGHLVGDAILKEVSRVIKENIRQIDLLGRYGGEEFSIILAETGKEEAHFAAERIRKAIEDKRIRVYDEDLKVTISIGISLFNPDTPDDAQALIEKADNALYQAKQEGRNKVCLYLSKPR
jgi:diguanylate cyclase (GGDEF)-like protein